MDNACYHGRKDKIGMYINIASNLVVKLIRFGNNFITCLAIGCLVRTFLRNEVNDFLTFRQNLHMITFFQ